VLGPAGLGQVDLERADTVHAGKASIVSAPATTSAPSSTSVRTTARPIPFAPYSDDRGLSGQLQVDRPHPSTRYESKSSRRDLLQLSIAAATSSQPSPTMNRCGRPDQDRRLVELADQRLIVFDDLCDAETGQILSVLVELLDIAVLATEATWSRAYAAGSE
jgi:hypothetical protein